MPPSGPRRATLPSHPEVATPDVEELEKRAKIRHLMARGRFADASEAIAETQLAGDEIALYETWIRNAAELAEDAESTLDPDLGTLAAAALRENRHLGFGYYVLGRIAEEEGRRDDAARAFRLATQLSPEHRDARRRDQLFRQRSSGS